MTELKSQYDSPFNTPFSLAKVIWSFQLKTPISISTDQVMITSCIPTKGGLVDGWNCTLESTYLAEALLQTEAQLLDEFRKIPEELISHKQINNRKLPKLIKERDMGSLSDFKSHWQSVVQYPLIHVTLAETSHNPQDISHQLINSTLLVKGIWVTQTKLGLDVEITNFQNQIQLELRNQRNS